MPISLSPRTDVCVLVCAALLCLLLGLQGIWEIGLVDDVDEATGSVTDLSTVCTAEAFPAESFEVTDAQLDDAWQCKYFCRHGRAFFIQLTAPRAGTSALHPFSNVNKRGPNVTPLKNPGAIDRSSSSLPGAICDANI